MGAERANDEGGKGFVGKGPAGVDFKVVINPVKYGLYTDDLHSFLSSIPVVDGSVANRVRYRVWLLQR